MLKAALLDMDGLMIDSEGFYWGAERQIAARYGKQAPDSVLRSMMGHSPLESIEILRQALELPAPAEELLRERDGLVLEQLRNEVEALPGLEPLLQTLHGRLRLAIVTGAPRPFVDAVLSRLPYRDLFDLIQTSDGIRKGKPDPEIYTTAARKLDLAPSSCVVLEDSRNGAQAGKRAGAYTVAVPNVQTADEDFGFADFVAKDLFEARTHILDMLG